MCLLATNTVSNDSAIKQKFKCFWLFFLQIKSATMRHSNSGVATF